MEPKVFCIGFHKTGTTSLGAALEILGFRVTGPNGVFDPEIASNAYSMACELVGLYDAFQDNPWPLLYKEMDELCPGSKFILTVRDSSSWVTSQVKHFGRRETPMRRWIYGPGCPMGNESVYVRRYEEHNEGVVRYFRDRPLDLLVMNLSKGDGWEELCRFLGKEVPGVPFPHMNKSSERREDKTMRARLMMTLRSLSHRTA